MGLAEVVARLAAAGHPSGVVLDSQIAGLPYAGWPWRRAKALIAEVQRTDAERRIAFIQDFTAVISAALTKDGARHLEDHWGALAEIADAGDDDSPEPADFEELQRQALEMARANL